MIERISRHLAADHANEYMMIDSTLVRVHPHSVGTRKKEAHIRPQGVPWRTDFENPCGR
ncbi:MAG: hypothetical protein ABF824_12565 [Acetobacter sp.]